MVDKYKHLQLLEVCLYITTLGLSNNKLYLYNDTFGGVCADKMDHGCEWIKQDDNRYDRYQ